MCKAVEDYGNERELEGLSKGMILGKKEGKIEGKKEGKKEGKIEIAKRLISLKTMTLEKIAVCTELSLEEIKKLAEEKSV